MSTRPSARRARTPASASASLAIVSSDPGRPVDSAVAWKTRMRRSARSEPSSSARLPHHLDAADGAHRTNRHRRPCSRTPDHQNDVDDPSRHRRNVAAVHFSNIRRFFGGQFSMSPGGQFRMSLDSQPCPHRYNDDGGHYGPTRLDHRFGLPSRHGPSFPQTVSIGLENSGRCQFPAASRTMDRVHAHTRSPSGPPSSPEGESARFRTVPSIRRTSFRIGTGHWSLFGRARDTVVLAVRLAGMKLYDSIRNRLCQRA